jgi:hypothetical protein
MWPIVAIAGASALAQFLNSEQARRLSDKERARIAKMVDQLQAPNFTQADFTPEDYKMLQQYVPEVAQNVVEQAPRTIQETSDMGQGRQAQLEALNQMRATAMAERDPALMAMMEQASRRGAVDAQSRQSAIMEGLARRGQLGGSAAVVAQMQGAGDAMERSAEAGRAAAIEAYRNRQQAMRGAAEVGGQVYSQDFQKERANTDIINDFNRRMADRQFAYNQYASGLRNEAQRYNIGTAQDLANRNVQGRNSAQDKWAQARQNMYQNEVNKVGLKSGQGQANVAAINQAAADRNQAIQGLSNAGMTYYGTQMEADQRQKDRDAFLKAYGE